MCVIRAKLGKIICLQPFSAWQKELDFQARKNCVHSLPGRREKGSWGLVSALRLSGAFVPRSAVAKKSGRRPTVRLLADSPPFLPFARFDAQRDSFLSGHVTLIFFRNSWAKKQVRFRKKEEDFPHKVGSFIVRLTVFSKARTKFNHKPINQNR